MIAQTPLGPKASPGGRRGAPGRWRASQTFVGRNSGLNATRGQSSRCSPSLPWGCRRCCSASGGGDTLFTRGAWWPGPARLTGPDLQRPTGRAYRPRAKRGEKMITRSSDRLCCPARSLREVAPHPSSQFRSLRIAAWKESIPAPVSGVGACLIPTSLNHQVL